MIQLSAIERRIWQVLHDRACAASVETPEVACLHYGQLGRLLDPVGEWRYPMSRPPFRGFNEALGHVSRYELEHDRPLLSALVTNADTNRPGEGFVPFVRSLGVSVDEPQTFWREELERVVAFWASGDVVLIVDAALDQIRHELTTLREQLEMKSQGSRPAP